MSHSGHQCPPWLSLPGSQTSCQLLSLLQATLVTSQALGKDTAVYNILTRKWFGLSMYVGRNTFMEEKCSFCTSYKPFLKTFTVIYIFNLPCTRPFK